VIVGADEVAAGEATLRDLRGASGQRRVAVDTVPTELEHLLTDTRTT
jgi:hypothetical protein